MRPWKVWRVAGTVRASEVCRRHTPLGALRAARRLERSLMPGIFIFMFFYAAPHCWILREALEVCRRHTPLKALRAGTLVKFSGSFIFFFKKKEGSTPKLESLYFKAPRRAGELSVAPSCAEGPRALDSLGPVSIGLEFQGISRILRINERSSPCPANQWGR